MMNIFQKLLFFITLLPFVSSFGHQSAQKFTSAVLQIAYDGTLFHGWSAGNDGPIERSTLIDKGASLPLKRGRSRRNKLRPSFKQGEIRSVEGVIKACLSKLYGNVPQDCIVVEGSSRTDKGVHAKGMIALIYCIVEGKGIQSIEGKQKPHPISPSDSSFRELPFNSDVQKLLYTLNKMLPPDVRIMNASYMPRYYFQNAPFHPSLSSVAKTYRYTISVGDIFDPIRNSHVWHIGNNFDIERARTCANVLKGYHDFIAFRGAFRGSERGKVQDTFCNIFDICISEDVSTTTSFTICKSYHIDITGDRFLYKMARFLVGCIVQYSTNDNINIQHVRDALEKGEWNGHRTCAPAHGLCLMKVHFPSSVDFQWIASNQDQSRMAWSSLSVCDDFHS
jgi:tRNA pseudouridine38-40 synthase